MNIVIADAGGLSRAIDVLRDGGVVAHATETCYGLACDMTNPAAVAALFVLKKRAADQPVSALFSSVEEAKQYVIWNERAEELAAGRLPGPLTLILPLRPDAPSRLFPTPGGGESLGMRVSPHPIARQLVTMFGRPLTTTSANVSGGPNPYSVAEIETQFKALEGQPNLILDSGTLPGAPPSEVVNCRTGAAIRK
jgi:L-threonylcarbamoyladenylate synthase